MKVDLFRSEIEVTPLVPPYADVDSYVLGPLRMNVTLEAPMWVARLYAWAYVKMHPYRFRTGLGEGDRRVWL